MLKNFDSFFNEGMEYTDFFGEKISHETALKKRTRDLITQIIVDEVGISEKSFTRYDQVIDHVKNMCDSNPEIYKNSEKYYNGGKRLQYCAEKIYYKYFKSPKLNESIDQDETKDVADKVKNSKKLTSEIKEKITPLIINGETKYKEGRVFRLRYAKSNGCDLGADKNGFFVFTHRARSKSYSDIDKIPEKDIKFIESTG